jgi:hypothetical protein
MADFLGSAIVSSGSRPPSFGTIHFFFAAYDFQQQLFVLSARHGFLKMLIIRSIIQRLTGLSMKLLSGPAADHAVELDVGRIEFCLARFSKHC